MNLLSEQQQDFLLLTLARNLEFARCNPNDLNAVQREQYNQMWQGLWETFVFYGLPSIDKAVLKHLWLGIKESLEEQLRLAEQESLQHHGENKAISLNLLTHSVCNIMGLTPGPGLRFINCKDVMNLRMNETVTIVAHLNIP